MASRIAQDSKAFDDVLGNEIEIWVIALPVLGIIVTMAFFDV